MADRALVNIQPDQAQQPNKIVRVSLDPDSILTNRKKPMTKDEARKLAEHWIADAPQLIGADGVHPTDDGHKYLAQRIAPIIAKTLTHG